MKRRLDASSINGCRSVGVRSKISCIYKVIILNTKLLVFNTQFLVFNTNLIIFTHVKRLAALPIVGHEMVAVTM